MDTSAHTTQMQAWLERMRAGDRAARDELLRGFCGRLERLARKMLRRFPAVHRWAQTDDVLQNSLMRLLRALEQVQPGTTTEFFGLAAAQMRRELLDLARQYRGPRGAQAAPDDSAATEGPAAPADDARDLERWCAFHEEVEKLPAEEREVVSLVFYHGWSQAEVAELFQVTVRTVQRRWQSALLKLQHILGTGDAS